MDKITLGAGKLASVSPYLMLPRRTYLEARADRLAQRLALRRKQQELARQGYAANA